MSQEGPNMVKIREGFRRIAIITLNSSRWRDAAPLQIRPVNWQQVSIRFQTVRDFLGHWVIQPQFLQLAISIRTKIKRITSPVKEQNRAKLLKTEQILRKSSVRFSCFLGRVNVKLGVILFPDVTPWNNQWFAFYYTVGSVFYNKFREDQTRRV